MFYVSVLFDPDIMNLCFKPVFGEYRKVTVYSFPQNSPGIPCIFQIAWRTVCVDESSLIKGWGGVKSFTCSHKSAVFNCQKSKSCLVCWLSCQIAVLIIKAKKLLKVYLERDLSDIWDSDNDVAEDSGILKCGHHVSGESLPKFWRSVVLLCSGSLTACL